MDSDLFWSNDLNVLFRKDRIVEFFPSKDMSHDEKLNSIARFSCYFGIILSILKKKSTFLIIPIVVLALTLFIYNYSETDDIVQTTTKPTADNPFMNVLPSDYTDNVNRLPADDVDDPEIKKAMKQNFDIGIYKDKNDPYDNKNSQREFYSMPYTTIPNDQDAFAKWLFYKEESDKGKLSEDDLAHQRSLVVFENNPVEKIQQQFILSNTRGV